MSRCFPLQQRAAKIVIVSVKPMVRHYNRTDKKEPFSNTMSELLTFRATPALLEQLKGMDLIGLNIIQIKRNSLHGVKEDLPCFGS